MSTDSLTCAATPAALADHVDYVQRIIENTHPGGITIVSENPAEEDRYGFTISHWRYFDTDNGRTYGIKAYVLSPTDGRGRLILRVDVRGERHDYGEVRLTTNPHADYALVSALNVIAEINEKQNS